MNFWSKAKGFTLVELLVVISILGILAAALTTQMGNAREAGRAVKCKTNLKNLAQAALAYATDEHHSTVSTEYWSRHMPWAKSSERAFLHKVHGRKEVRYRHWPGWVSWTWGNGPPPWPSEQRKGGKTASFHGEFSDTYHSLTNGALWRYTGADLDTYVCGEHVRVCGRKGVHSRKAPVRRSYVMNKYFGPTPDVPARSVSSLSAKGNAGALLLFAELPAYTVQGGGFVESVTTDENASDGVLEAQINGWDSLSSVEEIIGFNHRVGKRHVAHVAFADGHVEGVVAPESKDLTLPKLKDLTCLLCNGVDLPATPGEWASARTDHVKAKSK